MKKKTQKGGNYKSWECLSDAKLIRLHDRYEEVIETILEESGNLDHLITLSELLETERELTLREEQPY